MVWNVCSGEARQIATFEPSFEYYTQNATGLNVWEVVQIALAAMAFTCFTVGSLVGCRVAKLFGNIGSTRTFGTTRTLVDTSIPEGSTENTLNEPAVVQGTVVTSHESEEETAHTLPTDPDAWWEPVWYPELRTSRGTRINAYDGFDLR